MNQFANLQAPQPDPIFAVSAEAKAAGAEAINATLGVYTDEAGKPAVFPSIQTALGILSDELPRTSLSYSPLLGLDNYRTTVQETIFGNDQPLVASTASTGGTGGLAVNLRLLKEMHSDITLVVPVPAWANHIPLIKAAGITMLETPYLEAGRPSLSGIADALKQTSGPTAVLLQVSCHNPLGLDFTTEQWQELSTVLQESNSIAFMDYAYQGFGNEPDQETEPLRTMQAAGITTMFSWSAAKNHCIYGLRAGLAGCLVPDEATKATVEAYYATISRSLYSGAPTPGQWIVSLTQKHAKEQWLADLAEARTLLAQKRNLMIEQLPDEFGAALSGHGMFAVLPLDLDTITTLRSEQKVFILDDGRTNIASVPESRIEEFCTKLTASLS